VTKFSKYQTNFISCEDKTRLTLLAFAIKWDSNFEYVNTSLVTRTITEIHHTTD